MAKQRSIDTKFWVDPWVRKLNPLDRYLFIYLLTNGHSSWCGVYEMDLSIMAFESGIDERDLANSMLPKLSAKVIYLDGWVCFRNWEKYHDNGSEATKKGIENAWNAVPEGIRLRIRKKLNSKIPPIDPLVAPPSLTSTSSFTSTSTLTSIPDKKSGNEINAILDIFFEKNPALSYGSKPERDAAASIIKRFGFSETKGVVGLVLSIQGEPFAPVVTTPLEMWKKLAKVEIFLKGHKPDNQIRKA